MSNIRLIARLDIKGLNLIKSIQLEGLRVIGDPKEFAHRYYKAGVDELIYMDVVASLYGRNSLTDIIKRTAKDIFIPITVGGGVRSLDDASVLLRAGADKIALNTAAIKQPSLIKDLAYRFGSQSVVLSIEAKQISEYSWQAYTDNGREKTNIDVVEWAKQGQLLGAGEILLTSVDREGTRRGLDINLLRAVSKAVDIPIIASGGIGSTDHFLQGIEKGGASAIAIADALHYNRIGLDQFRSSATNSGIKVRIL